MTDAEPSCPECQSRRVVLEERSLPRAQPGCLASLFGLALDFLPFSDWLFALNDERELRRRFRQKADGPRLYQVCRDCLHKQPAEAPAETDDAEAPARKSRGRPSREARRATE